MSYAAPHTFTTGEVATAANLNLLTNDITALVTGANFAGIDASETTTSTSFTDLTTVGPTVTFNTGDRTAIMVVIGANLKNNTATDGAYMSLDVSGASTVAAVDTNAVGGSAFSANDQQQACFVNRYTGLTAGSNTWTAKYRAVTGGTATFLRRRVGVFI